MTRTITHQDIVREFKRVARDRPYYVQNNPNGDDNGCAYWLNDRPHCIAANVLANLGLDVKQALSGSLNSEIFSEASVTRSLAANGLHFTEEAKDLTYLIQSRADGGLPWGRAVWEYFQNAGL